MKKICFSSCILLFIPLLFLTSSFAQDTPQWQLPEGVKARIGKGWARDIALSPDNSQLAVATGIGVWLYNVQTGAEIVLLTGHTTSVNSIVYSPDGQTLASGSYSEIRLWNPSTQAHKTTFAHQRADSLAYSPDGRTLAVGRWRGVDLLNAQTGKRNLSLSGHTDSVGSLAFSPDGKKLASASSGWNEDTAVRLWNARTGKLLRTLTGHAHGIHTLVFSPDGNTLVGGAFDDTLRVWDANTGQNTRTLQEWSRSVAYSPDGRKIAIAQGSDLLLLNPNTGVLQQTFSGHTNSLISLVFSSDSNTLVSSSWDGTIRFWNVGTSSLRLTIEGHFNFGGIALAPNGNLIATASERNVFLWNTRDGRFNKVFTGERGLRDLIYSPDGQTLAIATTGRQIQLWNARTGRVRRTLSWEGNNSADLIAFSPNSKTLASAASWDRTIRVWNANNGRLQRTLTGPEGINSLVFSPNSKTLASASWDRTIRVWNLQTGQLQRTLEGHRNSIRALAFSPNGNTLVSGGRDEIRFWNPQTGQLQNSLEDVRGDALAFSRDGNTLATGWGRVIHLRNGRTGEFQRTIPTPSDVTWLAFTPDNKTLISGSWDSTILLWNMNALPEPIPEDVNLDGIVDVEDLITVARHFGRSVTDDTQLNPDLNGDGVVNRKDVLRIMTALEAAAGAPPVSSQTPMMLTAERLQHYIHTAKHLGNSDEGFQRGIEVLEELLATLRTDATATPAKTTLLPNYPNPFNPETWIPYELATPAEVKITIYDATGSVVRTLGLGHQPEGHYTNHDRAAYWDGRNTLGERVASGVYFYQLHADTVSLTRKMVILK